MYKMEAQIENQSMKPQEEVIDGHMRRLLVAALEIEEPLDQVLSASFRRVSGGNLLPDPAGDDPNRLIRLLTPLTSILTAEVKWGTLSFDRRTWEVQSPSPNLDPDKRIIHVPNIPRLVLIELLSPPGEPKHWQDFLMAVWQQLLGSTKDDRQKQKSKVTSNIGILRILLGDYEIVDGKKVPAMIKAGMGKGYWIETLEHQQ